ncbi:MAG: HEPN domain-containing protein [Stellaceae bacterium]
MNADEAVERRREAARWLTIGIEDARVAGACLRIDPPAAGMAAYHCQQAGEKLLKGLLIIAGVEFALTHDLNRLASVAEPFYPDAQDLFEAIRPLTIWGVAYRYPGVESVPEPFPLGTEIEQVLDVIRSLTDRLRVLVAE